MLRSAGPSPIAARSRPSRHRHVRSPRRPARALVAALALSLSVGTFGSAAPAWADGDRSALVEQQKAKDAKRSDLGTQLTGVSSDLGNVYLALADAEAKLPVAEGELAAADARVTQISDRLAQAEAESRALGEQIADGAQSIDRTRSALGTLARSTYRGGGLPPTVSLVTGATSSEQFMDQALATTAVARSQQDVLVTLESGVAQNRNKETRQVAVAARVAQLKDEAVRAKAAAQAKRDEVAALKADAEARRAELESHRAQIETQIRETEAAQQRIAQDIARIDEENRRRQVVLEQQLDAQQRAEQQARLTTQGVSFQNTGPGRFAPPANACVNSEWGMRIHPILGVAKMHEGLDMRAAAGVPQVAMTDGVVSSVHDDVGGGLMIVLNHGLIDGRSVVTKHLHMSSTAVSAGQSVAKGQVVGMTGATGRVTGPHVHHEAWVDGSSVNPRSFYGDQISGC